MSTPTVTPTAATVAPAKLRTVGLNFYYGKFHALHDINLDIQEKHITALIGPSGCGKSTFLRTLNRINETIRNAKAEGEVLLDGDNVLSMDVTALRRRVGMVFQKSNPFPKTIFDNIAYGPWIHRTRSARPSRVAVFVAEWVRQLALPRYTALEFRRSGKVMLNGNPLPSRLAGLGVCPPVIRIPARVMS